MKQNKSYPYNQHTAPESSAFKKICKETKELNLPKEYLLDLYIHVRSSRHNKAGTMTPFQPNVAATMEQNFPQYNKKLANIMTIMETIEPLVFMQNYDEHFNSGNYCNAVENGAVYEQFLSAAGKANRLIVINPNPFMVEEICAIEDDALRNRFTLVFKESRYAKVYRSAEQLKGIRIRNMV